MIDELLKKLKVLNDERFMLAMDDHWATDDYIEDRRLIEEIKKVKKQLKELGYEDEV